MQKSFLYSTVLNIAVVYRMFFVTYVVQLTNLLLFNERVHEHIPFYFICLFVHRLRAHVILTVLFLQY
jgi:hypothetical protein